MRHGFRYLSGVSIVPGFEQAINQLRTNCKQAKIPLISQRDLCLFGKKREVEKRIYGGKESRFTVSAFFLVYRIWDLFERLITELKTKCDIIMNIPLQYLVGPVKLLPGDETKRRIHHRAVLPFHFVENDDRIPGGGEPGTPEKSPKTMGRVCFIHE